MKTNTIIRTILYTVIINVLIACSAFQPKETQLPPIRVAYTLGWGDYTLLVAKEKGIFEKYGVNVEPVYYKVFTDSHKDLAAGQIDAALIAVGDAMNIARYTPIKIIGISDDGSYMPIVARSEINTIRGLQGKTIGTLVGTEYELMVFEMLKSVGMDATDVNIINIDPENVPEALDNDQIQAGFTWEPYTTLALKNGAHIIYPFDSLLRLFPDGITFRQSLIEQRPDEIHAFMKAWFDAVNYRLDNPVETRQIAAKYIGIPVEQIEPDKKLKVLTYNDNVAIFNPGSVNSIHKIAGTTAEYLISVGALAKQPDLTFMLDSQFFIVP